jgi:HEAT repeat protein
VARGAAAEVAAALDALAKLYAHSGQLDWDAARARAQEQEAGRKALVERLAALGPGGAEELARRYRETASVREKLLLAEALGRSVGGEAAGEIQALLEDEDVYSLRRELAVALGRRKEPEAAAAVAELIASEGDARIRVALVHTLTGAESGSALLARMAASDPTPEVRIEALAALGRSPGQAGAAAVAQAAQAADQPESVRVAAAQELARSFPDESVAALRSILEGEDDVKLRVSAVKALKRLQSAEAQALLSETAASDPSATVRQHARVALLGAENAGERR